MATLIEEVDAIAGKYEKMFDFEFKSRIQTSFLNARAEIIRREINRIGYLPNSFLYQINCTPTVRVDIAECCSINLDCAVTRSRYKIPSPIRYKAGNTDFQYVGTIDGKKSFAFAMPEDLPFIVTDRWLKGAIRYTYINGYLYILNDNPKNIRVRAAFNNPFDFGEITDCEGNNCIYEPIIEEDILYMVRQLVYQDLNIPYINNEQVEVKQEEETNGGR
jgi:hypothetical protein